MEDLLFLVLFFFLVREKRTLKWGFRKLGFYPSSTERFSQSSSLFGACFLIPKISCEEV